MKRLRRIGIFVTFLLVFVLTAGAAFAASPPHIRLEETGAKDKIHSKLGQPGGQRAV